VLWDKIIARPKAGPSPEDFRKEQSTLNIIRVVAATKHPASTWRRSFAAFASAAFNNGA
jgi:hypothetical protein